MSHNHRRHYNYYRDHRQEDVERDRDGTIFTGTGSGNSRGRGGRGGYSNNRSTLTGPGSHAPMPFRQHHNHANFHPHHHHNQSNPNYNNNFSSNGYGRRPNHTNSNNTPAHYSRQQAQSFSSSKSSDSILNAIPETVISAIHEATTLILTREQAGPIVEKLMNQSFVALDCEGANLGKNGKLSTVQIGTGDGKAYIFDVFNNEELIEELRSLLESENVVKAIHDCRNDSENFYCQYHINLKNVFDTQCAHTEALESLGKNGRDLGLNELCQTYGVELNYFKDTAAKKVYQRNPAFWLKRPMTPEMILYAASDVLTVANLYPKLKDKVTGSQHFKLVCNERINYHRLSNSNKQYIRQRESERRLKIAQDIDLQLDLKEKANNNGNNNSSAQNDNQMEGAKPKT